MKHPVPVTGKTTVAAKYSARVLSLELEATLKFCEGLNTPRALTIWLLVSNGEWGQLLELSCNPRDYDHWTSFMDDYAVTSVLQKNPRLPTNIDKEQVAFRKWVDAEQKCKATNQRIGDFLEDPHSVDSAMRALVNRIKARTWKILGARPTGQDLDYAYRQMRFGPGATTSCSGIVSQGRKYSRRPLDGTQEMVHFRAFAFPDLWKDAVTDVNIVRSSKMRFVPKNAKTDRVICIEPDLNIFFQLGVGALIRRKLARAGLNLNEQMTNQTWASIAHRLGLATVDLKAASDTIAYLLVELLLPPAWVDLLEFCRTPSVQTVEGEVVLEKWSSMGNGYTFELESLIFFAIASAVAEESPGPVSVYGDDIIIPQECFPTLLRALNFLGFEVNEEKTFGTGRFYESCGTDWFDGKNVRPFFFRSDHYDFESVCYLYANNARRWAGRRNNDLSCDVRVLPLWLRCFTAVGAKLRHCIPEGYGDVGFIQDLDKSSPRVRHPRKPGWGGFWFAFRRTRCVEKVISVEGSYLAFLNGTTSDFRRGVESLRGRFSPATTRLGYSLSWPNLGPWS